MAVKKKFALGRGLDSLIATDAPVRTEGSSSINEVAISQIKPNPNQPRREFDPEALQELADSIAQLGIVQPITLRHMEEGHYEIIAGERRWRASQLAGLTKIPAYIRTANDEKMMQMALVENIQREDLNAIEVALAYQQLIEQHRLTQDELSRNVGKNRATIANALRLLKLPAAVQLALQQRTLTAGHGRALLGLESPTQQMRLFREIMAKGCSVRMVEDMVARLNAGEEVTSGRKKLVSESAQNPTFTALREQLSSVFATKVQLTCNQEGKGKISIPFANAEELEQLMKVFEGLKH